jgi:hypothetical protein
MIKTKEVDMDKLKKNRNEVDQNQLFQPFSTNPKIQTAEGWKRSFIKKQIKKDKSRAA